MRSRTRRWSIVFVVGTSLFVLSLILALAVFPYLVETQVEKVSDASCEFTRDHVAEGALPTRERDASV